MWRGLHFYIIPPKTQVQSRDSLPNVTSVCVLITMHVCGCVHRLCYTIIATLLQVVVVTFTASCCTVSTTLADSSCNFRGFMHNFSPGLSCSCHGFVLHCQQGSSLDLLDNPPSFCQLSSHCLLFSTTPLILHAFTFV